MTIVVSEEKIVSTEYFGNLKGLLPELSNSFEEEKSKIYYRVGCLVAISLILSSESLYTVQSDIASAPNPK